MRDCVGRAEHGETRNGTEGEGEWGGLPGQAVCVLIDQHCCRIRLQRDGHIDWQSVSPGRNEACPPGKRFANANIVAPGSPSCCFSTDARGKEDERRKKIKKNTASKPFERRHFRRRYRFSIFSLSFFLSFLSSGSLTFSLREKENSRLTENNSVRKIPKGEDFFPFTDDYFRPPPPSLRYHEIARLARLSGRRKSREEGRGGYSAKGGGKEYRAKICRRIFAGSLRYEAADRVPWSVENRRRSISGRTKRKMTVVEVRHIARRSVDASGRAGGTRDASNAWWPASGTWNAAFQRDDSWPRFLLFTTPPSAKRAPSIRAAERVPTRKYRSPSISL